MKYYGVSAIALLVGLSACSSNPNPLSVIDTPMIKYKTEKVQAAVKQIPKNHPHYHEIRQLLIKQVNEDLHDHETYTTADRRAS